LSESVSSASSLLLSLVELGVLVTVWVSVSVEVESSSSVEVEVRVDVVELVVGLGELVNPDEEPMGESEPVGIRPVGITGSDVVVVSSDESVDVSDGVSEALSVSVGDSIGSRTKVLVSVVSTAASVVVVSMENCGRVRSDLVYEAGEDVHPEQQQGPRKQGRGQRHAFWLI
jgi:hypothetical protein